MLTYPYSGPATLIIDGKDYGTSDVAITPEEHKLHIVAVPGWGMGIAGEQRDVILLLTNKAKQCFMANCYLNVHDPGITGRSRITAIPHAMPGTPLLTISDIEH